MTLLSKANFQNTGDKGLGIKYTNLIMLSINPRKHDGVTFQQAASAFFDPFLKVVDASRNNEARDAIIGMDTSWVVLFVVHIEFEDDIIRIISARKATRQERNYYEN